MTHQPTFYAAWHRAEQESKLLYAYWAHAMARNDAASARVLKARLSAQRVTAHDAFVRLMDEARNVSLACRFRASPAKRDRP